MTAARRKRTSVLGFNLRTALAAVLAMALGAAVPVAAATTERLVIDWRTGLAIFGFDPVAYFTDAKPVVGLPELELAHAGAVWRFHNPGNRAAFVDRPDVYMPRFGGYDPLALARGIATPGHPQLWLVAGDRLYLFHSTETRDAFAAHPDQAISAAEARWPAVLRTLVP